MMDSDVKLSMEQAHDKWLTKTIVRAFLALVAIGCGTCAYNSRTDSIAQVQKAQLDTQKAQADAARAHDESLKAMWDHQK
jgi:hypothetical protein